MCFTQRMGELRKGAFLGTVHGSVENVFMRVSDTVNGVAWSYASSGGPASVRNCTFFVDNNASGTRSGTGSGKYPVYSGVATNLSSGMVYGTFVEESYGTSDMSLVNLLRESKENATFRNKQVGVFYGEYAWK